MPKCHYFLSLSDLEGGPIPLMEAMYLNLIPIATDTGFARDIIQNHVNGIILKVKPEIHEVLNAFSQIDNLKEEPKSSVSQFTWSRLAQITAQDFLMS